MADVGRITELWRAAADALERTEREQKMEFVLAADAIAHLQSQRDELRAECGRLQEQLDALNTCLPVIAHALTGGSAADALRLVDRALRAALGVVGEQETTR